MNNKMNEQYKDWFKSRIQKKRRKTNYLFFITWLAIFTEVYLILPLLEYETDWKYLGYLLLGCTVILGVVYFRLK